MLVIDEVRIGGCYSYSLPERGDMTTLKLEEFSSEITPELLAGMRKIASDDGRQFQAVVEDAFRAYIESRSRNVRPEFMAHARASIERNRGLLELLAQ